MRFFFLIFRILVMPAPSWRNLLWVSEASVLHPSFHSVSETSGGVDVFTLLCKWVPCLLTISKMHNFYNPHSEPLFVDKADAPRETQQRWMSWILECPSLCFQVYFKKIFHGCPLKINCSTTWENPATKGCVILWSAQRILSTVSFYFSDQMFFFSLP